jgi:prevent-host-death family protein
MRTASIRELHSRTGELVRAAASRNIVITERGRPVAILKPLAAADLSGKRFPKRDLRKLPKVRVDSTIYISEDRDGR